MEKSYSEAAVATEEGAIKLAVKALFEVVQTGAKHMELGVMRRRPDYKPGEPFAEWKVCVFINFVVYFAHVSEFFYVESTQAYLFPKT